MSALIRTYLDDEDTERARNFAEQVEETLMKMRNLVAAFTDLAELPNHIDDHAPVDVASVVEAALTSNHAMISAAKARVSVGKLPHVSGDPALLSRAVGHLIANAATYVDPELQPRISVSGARGRDGRVHVHVMDNGVGIPPDQLDQIFEPLVRHHAFVSHQGGIGIGLAVVRKIMQAHGGTVTAKPRRHGGTCFTLIFPNPQTAHDPFASVAVVTPIRTPELLPEQPVAAPQSRRRFFARPARQPQAKQSPRHLSPLGPEQRSQY